MRNVASCICFLMVVVFVGCSDDINTEGDVQINSEIIETRDDCPGTVPPGVFISGPDAVCVFDDVLFCVENLAGPAVIEWNLMGQLTFTPWNCIALNLINPTKKLFLIATVAIGGEVFCVQKLIKVVDSGDPC